MIEQFEFIIAKLICPREEKETFSIFNILEQFNEECAGKADIARALNAAFLISLSGNNHPEFERANRFLSNMIDSPDWEDTVRFYLKGIELVRLEIESACRHDPNFSDRLEALYEWVSNKKNLSNAEGSVEKIWSLFFPEAEGIRADVRGKVNALRTKRMVNITEPNPNPISEPARQILFTSNVLLTIPSTLKSQDEFPFNNYLREELLDISNEPQIYWYDHPIQIGVEQEKNEIFYGLRGLDEALEYEYKRGNVSRHRKTVCILSVSVTHNGIKKIAKNYLEEEFARSGSLKNIDVYVFTEEDTGRIIDEILAPAARHYLQRGDAKENLRVFGVDGEYGRHYSFLKAIAPFWSIFIQPEIRATFKIDLDQVFPQEELVQQSGASAFEHFKTPLWGARGLDPRGQPLELGMIAGALVNNKDISRSLFTPDVPFPDHALSPDDFIFFSTLPQALSTEAEMMTRYTTDRMDGRRTCIQRFHVTGGTNGILVDSLRRYRPFTPSFMGRAEDQAYILSTLTNPGIKLAYLHEDGLIMRHDKEAFAQEAIQSAYVSKLVGDYVRILYFSAYARALMGDVEKLKEILDPFTGCFISRIPVTVAYLRFGFKAVSFFFEGKGDQGLEFIRTGAKRIMRALEFVRGENSMLKQQYETEHLSWELYYDTLTVVEDALKNDDRFAMDLRQKAKRIIDSCSIRSSSR